MKRFLAVLMCVLMVGSVFAFAISAGAVGEDAAEDDSVVSQIDDGSADQDKSDIAPQGAVEDETQPSDETQATEDPDKGETVPEEETTIETTDETTAETTGETVAPTTDSTTPSEAATVAPTTSAKDKNVKTGDNLWLFIGIGIFVVALIAIIITFAVKKKSK